MAFRIYNLHPDTPFKKQYLLENQIGGGSLPAEWPCHDAAVEQIRLLEATRGYTNNPATPWHVETNP